MPIELQIEGNMASRGPRTEHLYKRNVRYQSLSIMTEWCGRIHTRRIPRLKSSKSITTNFGRFSARRSVDLNRPALRSSAGI